MSPATPWGLLPEDDPVTTYQLRDRVEDTTTGMVGTVTAVSHLLGRRLLTIRWDESTLGEKDAETDLRPFDDDAEERRLSERANEVLAQLK